MGKWEYGMRKWQGGRDGKRKLKSEYRILLRRTVSIEQGIMNFEGRYSITINYWKPIRIGGV
jgi:hypothetical protein